MSNDLVHLPSRDRDDGFNRDANADGKGQHVPEPGTVYDPLVPARFVEVDEVTGGVRPWDLPPEDKPWEGYEAAKEGRRGVAKAERDAEWAHRHGLHGYAYLREVDAGDNAQSGWDWGDANTWLIIWGMFFAFLIVAAWVYFMPEGRHNQQNVPFSMPPIHVYLISIGWLPL